MSEIEILSKAVEYLQRGERVNVGDLWIEVEKYAVIVIGFSDFANLENISQQIALRELRETKELFLKMVLTSEKLKDFVSDKTIKYHLNYDTGKASFPICSEVGNLVSWNVNLPNK